MVLYLMSRTTDVFLSHSHTHIVSHSLFSQYTWTVVGVGGGTGYALWRRPKNGLGLMLVAGAAGTMADFAYGWKVACRDAVRRWQESQ